jgi:hypothetical protein
MSSSAKGMIRIERSSGSQPQSGPLLVSDSSLFLAPHASSRQCLFYDRTNSKHIVEAREVNEKIGESSRA